MGALTKLQAVNRMLIRAGEYPVSTLSAAVNDVSLAVNILDDVTVQAQSASDSYLTLKSEYTPDNNGHIVIPDNTIAVRGTKANSFESLSTRGRNPTLLYDMVDNTTEFDDSKWLEITLTMDFEDMPTKKQEYVADMAARVYQMLVHGDANVDAMLAQKEYFSRAEWVAQDSRSRRASYFRSNADARKAAGRDNFGGWYANGSIW